MLTVRRPTPTELDVQKREIARRLLAGVPTASIAMSMQYPVELVEQLEQDEDVLAHMEDIKTQHIMRQAGDIEKMSELQSRVIGKLEEALDEASPGEAVQIAKTVFAHHPEGRFAARGKVDHKHVHSVSGVDATRARALALREPQATPTPAAIEVTAHELPSHDMAGIAHAMEFMRPAAEVVV